MEEYEFDIVPDELEEGQTGTFTVSTTEVANGTTLYWSINNVTSSNTDFVATSGSFVIQSDAGSFTVSIGTDLPLEGGETFTVSIRTGSISGTVRATSENIFITDGIPTFNNTVNVQGSGLWQSNIFPALFMKFRPSYTTNVDPGLPNYDFLTSNLAIWSNAEIAVSNISLFPSPSNITSNATVFANTFIVNGSPVSSTLVIPVSNTSGVAAGYKIVTANIPSAANASVQRVLANGSVVIENLPLNSNLLVSSNEICYFYPKTVSYRILKSFTSNTATANVLLLTMESVDDIRIGSLASSANILASVSDDTLTTVKRIFSTNNTVLIQNIDANLTINAGDYVSFSTRPTVGAVRIRGEVIRYERLWAANSRLTNLTRNVGGTTNSTISGNLTAGNLVSILGLQTVSS